MAASGQASLPIAAYVTHALLPEISRDKYGDPPAIHRAVHAWVLMLEHALTPESVVVLVQANDTPIARVLRDLGALVEAEVFSTSLDLKFISSICAVLFTLCLRVDGRRTSITDWTPILELICPPTVISALSNPRGDSENAANGRMRNAATLVRTRFESFVYSLPTTVVTFEHCAGLPRQNGTAAPPPVVLGAAADPGPIPLLVATPPSAPKAAKPAKQDKPAKAATKPVTAKSATAKPPVAKPPAASSPKATKNPTQEKSTPPVSPRVATDAAPAANPIACTATAQVSFPPVLASVGDPSTLRTLAGVQLPMLTPLPAPAPAPPLEAPSPPWARFHAGVVRTSPPISPARSPTPPETATGATTPSAALFPTAIPASAPAPVTAPVTAPTPVPAPAPVPVFPPLPDPASTPVETPTRARAAAAPPPPTATKPGTAMTVGMAPVVVAPDTETQCQQHGHRSRKYDIGSFVHLAAVQEMCRQLPPGMAARMCYHEGIPPFLGLYQAQLDHARRTAAKRIKQLKEAEAYISMLTPSVIASTGIGFGVAQLQLEIAEDRHYYYALINNPTPEEVKRMPRKRKRDDEDEDEESLRSDTESTADTGHGLASDPELVRADAAPCQIATIAMTKYTKDDVDPKTGHLKDFVVVDEEDNDDDEDEDEDAEEAEEHKEKHQAKPRHQPRRAAKSTTGRAAKRRKTGRR